MRSNRLTTFILSAIMALTTVGFAATTASADYDKHPNTLVEAILVQEDIAATANNWQKARLALGLIKALRHWDRDHDDPRWVRGSACNSEFDAFEAASYRYARTAFRYFRGKATRFMEYPAGWERKVIRVRQMLMMDRAESRLDDEIEDVVDECFFNRTPRRLRYLIG